ncbi:MAG: peptide chain release factor 2 [Chloroflexi bacterium]|nr:peptide chain release factor 2 [Chloroflexota bacterium]
MSDLSQTLTALQDRISDLLVRLDIPAKEQEITALEEQANDPDFWGDSQTAQTVMRRISDLREQIETWRGIGAEAGDMAELAEMAAGEDDASLETDLRTQGEALSARVDDLEFQLALGGEYDRNSAILAIHAGAGGTEAQDWAEMLLRMYLRYAERSGYRTEIVDMSQGEEAGIKSATVEVSGPLAYGYLKSERGVHRLVRISPFDAAHGRHTSFALVEVLPEVDGAVDVTVNADDLKVDVYRSAGAGGQNVQKNSTAIRITHLPTGIVVTCQNERSQLQNREMAMRILKARLMEIELRKKEEERARLKGQHISAGWGNQIRSYVLHPYKMVKDLRTEFETSNPDAVLDGDLDALIRAYLKSTVGEATA